MRILNNNNNNYKVNKVSKITRIYKPKKKLKEDEKECPMCHSIFGPTNKYEFICQVCAFDDKN